MYVALTTACSAGKGWGGRVGKRAVFAGLSLSTAVITFHRARGACAQCKMLASLANAAQVFFAEDPCLSLLSATNVNSSDLDNSGLQRSILFSKQKYSIKYNKSEVLNWAPWRMQSVN